MSKAVQSIQDSSLGLSDSLLGNRYQLLTLIGQGGFGKTFLAADLSKPFSSRCVLKQSCLPHQHAALFHKEALQLAHLGKHTQIPVLLGVFEQDGYQYLVQEWIDGQNLEQELDTTGPFNEAEIWQLLNELLPILQFVHKHQIIHRDIKPANIIRRCSDNQLVLVDFGASKVSSIGDLGKTGTMIGSAEYTAPEQLRGKAIFASDLYSLGVTCLHLLTGISPFQLFDDHDNHWIWENYLNTSISKSLRQILKKLVQPATRLRYASVEAVLHDTKAKALLNATSKMQVGDIEDQELCTQKRNLAPISIKVLKILLLMQSGQSATLFDPNTQQWYQISISNQASDLTQYLGTRLADTVTALPPRKEFPSKDLDQSIWSTLTKLTVGTITVLVVFVILLAQDRFNHLEAKKHLQFPYQSAGSTLNFR